MSLQHEVAHLRAFVRFLAVRGEGPVGLDTSIDTPRVYRDEQLPRALPWETVRAASETVNAAAASIGATIDAPFMILAFVGLAGVPDLGLTERGLIDVATQGFCEVVLTPQPGQRCCRCPSHAHLVHGVFDPAGALA